MWFSPLLCANVHVLHVLRGSFVGPSFKVTVHFDMNTHLVFKGEYIKSLEEIKNMIAEEFLRMPNATSFPISLFANKTFLSCHLFNDYGEGLTKFFKGEKLNQTMLKFDPMCSPNICNQISLFKKTLTWALLDSSLYSQPLVLTTTFKIVVCLGNKVGKSIIFSKRWLKGIDGCGVHLVKQMQLGGDLKNSYMMFNHVKHVQGWLTMACHVYDLVYYKVMFIAIYNM